MNPIVLGIDPRIVGGWAVLDELGAIVAADDLPVAGDGAERMVSASLFAAILRRYRPSSALIERVGAMPGQGVSSSFMFGRALGVIEGVIGACDCPVMYVAPAVWKKHFHLGGSDKEPSRQRAIETWPSKASELFARKKDHGRAEAALVALWGLRASIAGGANV